MRLARADQVLIAAISGPTPKIVIIRFRARTCRLISVRNLVQGAGQKVGGAHPSLRVPMTRKTGFRLRQITCMLEWRLPSALDERSRRLSEKCRYETAETWGSECRDTLVGLWLAGATFIRTVRR